MLMLYILSTGTDSMTFLHFGPRTSDLINKIVSPQSSLEHLPFSLLREPLVDNDNCCTSKFKIFSQAQP
jgi:hypothetical protein